MDENNFIDVQNAVYEEKLNEDIEILNLPTKAYNALKRKNINTIRELLKLTKKELYSVRNLGEEGIKTIIVSLRDLGLKFNFELEEKSPSTKEDYLYLHSEYLKAIKQKQEQMYNIQREIWQLQCRVSEYENIIGNMDLEKENNYGLHM